MLTCRQASQLSSEAQDRALSLRERLGLTLHLSLCALCRRYARQLAFLHAAAENLASKGVPEAGLTEEARERIRRNLEKRREM
jgi:hypothetical protein